MRLSEAIRLGSLIRPQCRGYLFKDGGSCAWGAAEEAVGTSYNENLGANYGPVHGAFRSEWNWTTKAKATCPGCGEIRDVDWILSLHLNDRHYWTREQIADWVETQERALGLWDEAPQEAITEQDPMAMIKGGTT